MIQIIQDTNFKLTGNILFPIMTSTMMDSDIELHAQNVVANTTNQYFLLELLGEDLHMQIKNQNKINFSEMLSFKHGWNGYDAPPFNKDFVISVKESVDKAYYPPKVFAGNDGEIQLEYYKDDDNYTNIEITESGIMVYHLKNGKEAETTYNKDELNQVLKEYGHRQFAAGNR